LQPFKRQPSGFVISDRDEEVTRAGELAEPKRCDRSAAGRLDPALARLDDRSRLGHALDGREPDPFDVADHGCAHARQSHTLAADRVRQDDGACARS
jgi:hypothetical protein